MNVLLFPPIAFLLYLGLIALLSMVGQKASSAESTAYASGEMAPNDSAASGYKAFSQFALFFAVFHLGILLLATAGAGFMSFIFLIFLMLLLVVLML
jgi:NADH:ubiquinone oxidoreductase subunit 3 (subunit A)